MSCDLHSILYSLLFARISEMCVSELNYSVAQMFHNHVCIY